MVDFNDNYIDSAKMTKINNESTGWNKKIQKPQLRGGIYYFKCNCDLTNGLQDDCRNPNCRSSYTKLTKRTCSCGRSMLKKDSEKPSIEEKKKDVGDGDAAVKESKKAKEPKEKEPDVISVKEPKKSKEIEEQKITAKESKQIEIKEINTKETKEPKEPKEEKIKEVKAKESKELENKENKKPKEKESTESKKVKVKESQQSMRKKITTRRI